jgi:hypothetical protein
MGWTGLNATEAKRGISAAGTALATVRVDGTEMYVDPALLPSVPALSPDEVLALPGFDEYLLGYKDRSMMVDDAHKQAIIPGGNGVFQSTVVRGGRVMATWKRTTGRAKTVVSVALLVKVTQRERSAVEAAFEPYTRYLGSPVEVRFAD